jgi:hypothetical protein
LWSELLQRVQQNHFRAHNALTLAASSNLGLSTPFEQSERLEGIWQIKACGNQELCGEKRAKGKEPVGYDSGINPLRGSIKNCNVTENADIGISATYRSQLSISGHSAAFSGAGVISAGIYVNYSNAGGMTVNSGSTDKDGSPAVLHQLSPADPPVGMTHCAKIGAA